jgi:Protein required for attachment to host cells
MIKPQFIIVADRGAVKAYRVEDTANRGKAARLVDQEIYPEAHERLQDIVTDKLGAFPAKGKHNVSGGGREGVEAELSTRLIRQVSQKIAKIVSEHRPVRWSFAAPAEINTAILNQIADEHRQKLCHNLKRNLVKTEPRELLEYFDGASSIT